MPGDLHPVTFDRPTPPRVGVGGARWEPGGPSEVFPAGASGTRRQAASRRTRSKTRRLFRGGKKSGAPPGSDSTSVEDQKKRRPTISSFKKKRGSGTGVDMDPRIAERARRVREKEERKAFKRAVWLLGVMAAVGVGFWVANSPYLAVRNLVVTGQVSSSAMQILRDTGVAEGVPMLSVEEDLLREGLLADPWVADVEIEKAWPGTVRIALEERYPVAWALDGRGWRAVSSDGVELDVDSEEHLPHVTGLAGAPLDLTDPGLQPALSFLEHLRSDLLITTALEVHGGQVTAEVAGRIVRLGRATDLEEKAKVLGALIDHHTDPGSVINLLSPFRPAVYRGVDTEIVVTSPSS